MRQARQYNPEIFAHGHAFLRTCHVPDDRVRRWQFPHPQRSWRMRRNGHCVPRVRAQATIQLAVPVARSTDRKFFRQSSIETNGRCYPLLASCIGAVALFACTNAATSSIACLASGNTCWNICQTCTISGQICSVTGEPWLRALFT